MAVRAYVVDGWLHLAGIGTAHPSAGSGVVDIDLIAANATGADAANRAVRITGNANVGVAPVEKVGLIQWLPFDVVENLRSDTVSISVWARVPGGSGFNSLRIALVEWTADVDPDAGRAHTQLGSTHGLYGDKQIAIENLERALELDPDNEGLRLRLVGVRAFRRED